MKFGFNENEIIQYLEAEAEADLDFYYIYGNVRAGLVHYVDRRGTVWVLMEDDTALAEATIRFLIDRGNPAFESYEEARTYGARLKMKILSREPEAGLGN